MEIQQLELELWRSLETASQFPETADLRSLCDALEQTISSRSVAEQFDVVGNVLVQLSEVCAARSQLMISTWEHRHTRSEPMVDLEDCVELFVQSLSLDVAELFEAPEPVQYPANRKQKSQSTTPPQADGVCKSFCSQTTGLDCNLVSSLQAPGNVPLLDSTG